MITTKEESVKFNAEQKLSESEQVYACYERLVSSDGSRETNSLAEQLLGISVALSTRAHSILGGLGEKGHEAFFVDRNR